MGDANADGFGDLAVVVQHQGGPDTVRLYLGGAGPAATPAEEVSDSISSDAEVISLLSGDMNGDGLADLFQSYLGQSTVGDVVSSGRISAPETRSHGLSTRRLWPPVILIQTDTPISWRVTSGYFAVVRRAPSTDLRQRLSPLAPGRRQSLVPGT
jgi:hypothetical protein